MPIQHIRSRRTAFALAATLLASLPGLVAPALGNQAGVAAAAAMPRPSLGFEPNAGQVDPSVRYLLHDGHSTMLFTTSGALVALARTVVHVDFAGAMPARISAGKQLPGRTNYLVGRSPSRWRAGTPAFDSIAYDGMYPGVRLVYSGRGGVLESTYRLQPGADPGRITIRYAGVRSLSLDAAGNLVMRAGSGAATAALSERAPTAWQDVNGERRGVSAAFAVDAAARTVRFSVGRYDRALPLTIDPVLAYATYLGGSGEDHPWAIASDETGATYLTGYTYSTNFPATTGAYQTTAPPDANAFVTKLDAQGRLVYSTYLGGSGFDNAFALHVDRAGDVYITGATLSTDFPLTSGALQRTNAGGASAFISELDPTGSRLLASTYLGGSIPDHAQITPVQLPPHVDNENLGTGIVTDATGEVYVSGETDSVNFPVTTGAVQPLIHGDYDGFFVKIAPGLTTLDYSTFIGGSGYDFASSIAVDQAGDVYLAGETTSSQLFPTTAGALQTSHSSGYAAWVAKLNATGSTLLYCTYFGGTTGSNGPNYTVPSGLAVDAAGDAYIAGETNATDLPTTLGVVQPTLAGQNDAFIAELNSTGTGLVFSTYLGGSDYDGAFGVNLDAAGDTYVIGYTSSHDLPTTANALQHSRGRGTHQAFAGELGSGGTAIRWLSYLGGSVDDFGYGVAVDPAGALHVMGITQSPDFPTVSAMQPTYAGGSFTLGGFDDGFVAMIVSSPASGIPEQAWPLELPLAAAAVIGIAWARRRRRRG